MRAEPYGLARLPRTGWLNGTRTKYLQNQVVLQLFRPDPNGATPSDQVNWTDTDVLKQATRAAGGFGSNCSTAGPSPIARRGSRS